MSAYARDVGVSVPTIKRWLSILEASYIIFLVSPYHENYGKRIIKSPKVYFFDTGLVSYLTGITAFEQYNQGPLAGALFENYVVSEIYKNELHTAALSELFYFRTQDKVEIDLIVDRKATQDFIEIKKSATFNPRMIQPLIKYGEKATRRILLYIGEKFFYRNVDILSLKDYLG